MSEGTFIPSPTTPAVDSPVFEKFPLLTPGIILDGLTLLDSTNVTVSYGLSSSGEVELPPKQPQFAEPTGRVDQSFFIYYKDVNGNDERFEFDLLPAVDHRLFDMRIPGLRKGVEYSAQMQRAIKIIPGGMYVVQTVGIKNLSLYLCGLMVAKAGLEASISGDTTIIKNGVSSKVQPYKGGPGVQRSSYRLGQEILNYIISLGSPVTIEINSEDIQIRHKCLIEDYQLFTTRADRTYYVIRATVIDNILPRSNSDILSEREKFVEDIRQELIKREETREKEAEEQEKLRQEELDKQRDKADQDRINEILNSLSDGKNVIAAKKPSNNIEDTLESDKELVIRAFKVVKFNKFKQGSVIRSQTFTLPSGKIMTLYPKMYSYKALTRASKPIFSNTVTGEVTILNYTISESTVRTTTTRPQL